MSDQRARGVLTCTGRQAVPRGESLIRRRLPCCTFFAAAALLLAAPAWAETPLPLGSAWLGVDVANLLPHSLEQQRLELVGIEGGVLVKNVVEDSPADDAGLRQRDVITSFDERKVRTVQELAADLASARPGERAILGLLRGERLLQVPVVLSAPPRSAVATSAELPTVSETQLARLFPRANRFSRRLQPVPHYTAHGAADSLIGVAFLTTEVCPEASQGYKGPISTLVGLSPAGKIVGAIVLEQSESFRLSGTKLEQFLRQYEGQDASRGLVLGEDVDAISGATITSSAINYSIEEGSRIILAAVLNIEKAAAAPPLRSLRRPSIPWIRDLILLPLLIVLALAGYLRGGAVFRFLILGMTLFYIGYLKGGGISLHDVVILLQGDMPQFAATTYWYLLICFAFVSTLIIGRFYCGWLCPFGALTEMLYRLVPRYSVEVPIRIDAPLRLLKYLLLIVVLLAVVFFGQRLAGELIETVEPFGVLFQHSGSLFGLLFLALILVGSFFISRLYCRYLCPLGALFAVLTIGASFINQAVLRRPQRPRRCKLTKPLGGCAVNALRPEGHFAALGIRSGECIACTPSLMSRRRPVKRPAQTPEK